VNYRDVNAFCFHSRCYVTSPPLIFTRVCITMCCEIRVGVLSVARVWSYFAPQADLGCKVASCSNQAPGGKLVNENTIETISEDILSPTSHKWYRFTVPSDVSLENEKRALPQP
jgi:hypothetical protein